MSNGRSGMMIVALCILLGAGCAPASSPESNAVIPAAELAPSNTTTASELFGLPVGAFDVSVTEFDFNQDGVNESIVYFRNLIALNGQQIEKQYVNVYRVNESAQLVIDHADEGGTGGNIRIDAGFLSYLDIEQDGDTEVRITKRIDGTGGYSQSYLLVWDGQKVTELFEPDEQAIKQREDVRSLLGPDESLGTLFVSVPTSRITICSEGGMCEYKASAPDAIGSIEFDLVYADGDWLISNARRIDY